MAGSSLQNIVTRAVITALDTAKKMPGRGSEVDRRRTKRKRGASGAVWLYVAAQDGAEAVMLFPGGDRSHGVAVVVADRRYRLKGLKREKKSLFTTTRAVGNADPCRVVVNGGGKPLFSLTPKSPFRNGH